MCENFPFIAKPKKSKVETAWQLLEEQNEAIRENSGLGYYKRMNRTKSQHNNPINYSNIQQIQ